MLGLPEFVWMFYFAIIDFILGGNRSLHRPTILKVFLILSSCNQVDGRNPVSLFLPSAIVVILDTFKARPIFFEPNIQERLVPMHP